MAALVAGFWSLPMGVRITQRPSRPRATARRPYTPPMAGEDSVLEEAMAKLKEAGQRVRATQSLMRSQGMEEGQPIAAASYDR